MVLTFVISPRAALVCRTAAAVFDACRVLLRPIPEAAWPPLPVGAPPAAAKVRGMAVGRGHLATGSFHNNTVVNNLLKSDPFVWRAPRESYTTGAFFSVTSQRTQAFQPITVEAANELLKPSWCSASSFIKKVAMFTFDFNPHCKRWKGKHTTKVAL